MQTTTLKKQAKPVRLSTPPMFIRFIGEADGQAEAKLVDTLEKYHKRTSTIILTCPNDVFFDSKGRVQGRYELSTLALTSLCSKLLPGLAQTVNNLAGSFVRDDQELSASTIHDPVLALRWINDTIKLRFEKIKGFSLVVDTECGRIEGIVGRKYAFLPNLELYRRAKEFVSKLDRPAAFNEAALIGRRLMLRFREIDPLFNLGARLPEQYYGGYHFANSETGDCSVKASAVIVRQQGDSKSISEFADGSKIAHIKGKAFDRKFAELLDRVRIKTSEQIHSHESNMIRLMQTNLGLGNNDQTHKRRVKQLETFLQKHGLHSEFSQSVVRHVLVQGSHRTALVQVHQKPMQVYSTRTLLDLYNALTYRAKTLPLEEQEVAEQLAYKVLIGKVTP
jgi:hypothetical protein